MNEIKLEDLKKGDWIKHSHLGSTPLVGGYIMESPKQGRGLKKAIMIFTKGTEIGFFDEAGSVYASDVVQVRRDGAWQQVTGHPEVHKL